MSESSGETHTVRCADITRFVEKRILKEALSDAERQAAKLGRWLAKKLPDVEVPVRSVVIFASPKVELYAEGALVPTFFGKKLKGWLLGTMLVQAEQFWLVQHSLPPRDR